VLATFRSSRNSCIGLLGKSIRIKYIDIDLKQRAYNQESKKETTSLSLFWSLDCSCLLGARARTSKQEQSETKKETTK